MKTIALSDEVRGFFTQEGAAFVTAVVTRFQTIMPAIRDWEINLETGQLEAGEIIELDDPEDRFPQLAWAHLSIRLPSGCLAVENLRQEDAILRIAGDRLVTFYEAATTDPGLFASYRLTQVDPFPAVNDRFRQEDPDRWQEFVQYPMDCWRVST